MEILKVYTSENEPFCCLCSISKMVTSAIRTFSSIVVCLEDGT
jgi:hypothetical protein